MSPHLANGSSSRQARTPVLSQSKACDSRARDTFPASFVQLSEHSCLEMQGIREDGFLMKHLWVASDNLGEYRILSWVAVRLQLKMETNAGPRAVSQIDSRRWLLRCRIFLIFFFLLLSPCRPTSFSWSLSEFGPGPSSFHSTC